jgi:hypothetical protein
MFNRKSFSSIMDTFDKTWSKAYTDLAKYIDQTAYLKVKAQEDAIKASDRVNLLTLQIMKAESAMKGLNNIVW